jgi:hypothetical protein
MVCGLLDSTDLQRRIETAGDRVDEPGAVLDAEIAGLETRLAALLKKEEGLVERWRRGLISDQVFDPSLERSKVERGRLAAELERRRGDWERLQQAVSPEGGEKLIDRVRTNLEAATSEERALVLRTLCPIHQQHGIYLHPDGGVELRAVIPISEAQRLCRTAAPPCSSPP